MDAFYAIVLATSGDHMPILILEDHGGKPERNSKLAGSQPSARQKYRRKQDTANHRLCLSALSDWEGQTSGEHRFG